MYVKLRVCSPSPQISISCAPRQLRLDDLAAQRRRRLLATAVPGAVRPVDVVVAGDAAAQSEVLVEVAAHPLAEELLPAVAVLRQGGIRVLFGQAVVRRVGLLRRVVDARGRREEEALCPRVASGHQQVRVDERAEHAEGLVVLDEAHAAHVGREVVDARAARDRRCAGVDSAQVENHGLHAVVNLVPVVERLDVDRDDRVRARILEVLDEVAADEAARTRDEDPLSAHPFHDSRARIHVNPERAESWKRGRLVETATIVDTWARWETTAPTSCWGPALPA